jgi:hypothetical protein
MISTLYTSSRELYTPRALKLSRNRVRLMKSLEIRLEKRPWTPPAIEWPSPSNYAVSREERRNEFAAYKTGLTLFQIGRLKHQMRRFAAKFESYLGNG